MDIKFDGEYCKACDVLESYFKKFGWTEKDIMALCKDETVRNLLLCVRGMGEIKIFNNAVDCNTDPFVPPGWSVVSHNKLGIVDASRLSLYRPPKQSGFLRNSIDGAELRNILADKPVPNANVLDYLLQYKNNSIIPREWHQQGLAIFFWGTIYQVQGHLVVRYLKYDLGWDDTPSPQWKWDYKDVCSNFIYYNPAAIFY